MRSIHSTMDMNSKLNMIEILTKVKSHLREYDIFIIGDLVFTNSRVKTIRNRF